MNMAAHRISVVVTTLAPFTKFGCLNRRSENRCFFFFFTESSLTQQTRYSCIELQVSRK